MDHKYSYGGEARGYGFVEMPSKSEGEAAITGLEGKTLDGQVITVIGALPLSPKREINSFHGSRGRRLRSEKRASA
jgi:RNA recognition motif-containing protein